MNGRQIDGSKLERLVKAKGKLALACVAADIGDDLLRGLFKGETPTRRDTVKILSDLAAYLGLSSYTELLKPLDERRTA